MGKFDNNNKSGGFKGKGFGKRDFKGRGFSGGGERRFGDSGQARPPMFQGTCSKCGKECQLPFRPTGERPVFCSNCFALQGNVPFQKPEGNNFNRPRFEEKRLFQAVCSKCGNNCEVPFRPMEGKPVFCNNCFSKDGNTNRNSSKDSSTNRSSEVKNHDNYKFQFDMLNSKLDKIIKMLSATGTTELTEVKKTIKEIAAITAEPVKKKKALGASKVKAAKKKK